MNESSSNKAAKNAVEEFLGRLESIDLTPLELSSILLRTGHSILPYIIRDMLRRGLIDPEQAHDREYLLAVVKNNTQNVLMHNVEYTRVIHNDFLEVAQATKDDKPAVSIILIATAVEHLANLHYREVWADRGLSHEEIKEALRGMRLHAKIKLLPLVGQSRLPDELVKRILHLAELRNRIIHYKDVPSVPDEGGNWEDITDVIRREDLDDLLGIPYELQDFLESALEQADPDRQLAKELYEFMIGLRGEPPAG